MIFSCYAQHPQADVTRPQTVCMARPLLFTCTKPATNLDSRLACPYSPRASQLQKGGCKLQPFAPSSTGIVNVQTFPIETKPQPFELVPFLCYFFISFEAGSICLTICIS